MVEQKQNTKCRCLRSKSSYSAFGEYSKDHEALMGTTSTFWCLKTMSKADRMNITYMPRFASKVDAAGKRRKNSRP